MQKTETQTVRKFGDCTLILGDCLALVPIEADAVISDPPYGIGYQHGGGKNSSGAHCRINTEKIHGDDAPFDPSPWLGYKHVALFGANHYAQRLPVGGWHVWDKLSGVPSFDDFSDAEFFWTKNKGCTRIVHYLWKGVLREDNRGEPRFHVSQKPVPVMARAMQLAGVPAGATVLDPYMGSGSTAIACIRTGRKFIGVEIDAGHYEIACARVEEELSHGSLFSPDASEAKNFNPEQEMEFTR